MRAFYIGLSFFTLIVLSPVMADPAYALENTQESTEVSFFVDAININGNIRTSFDFILNNLTFNSGSTISFDEIEESRLKLEATWLFSSVNLSFKKGREKGHVIVDVALIEYDSLTYGANLGFGQRVLQGESLKYDNYIGFWANNSNLFGYGKTGELGINRYSSTPFSRGAINGTYDILMLKAQYIDPKLFQSSKYFFKINTTFIDFGHESSSRYQMGVELGRRLINEHYFSFGGFYTPASAKLDSDKEVFIAYGFDDQDDAIFPTSGSAYVLRLSCGTYRGIGKEGRIKYEKAGANYAVFHGFSFLNHWRISGSPTDILTFGFSSLRPHYYDLSNKYAWASLKYSKHLDHDVYGIHTKQSRYYLESGFYKKSFFVKGEEDSSLVKKDESKWFPFLEVGTAMELPSFILKISLIAQ